MKISIIGTGYIGLIQAVGLAKLGFKITSLDVFQDKIDKLKSGIPTIYEDGLQELLNETYKNINWTTDKSEIIGSEIIFICVGTPQDDSGKTDLGYVFGAINDIKPFLNGDEIIIIKSTVPVGTNKKVFEMLEGKNKIVSNPEFLREGLAIKDFFNPDRIVFGFGDLEDKKTISKVKKVYNYCLEKNIPVLETDWQTAELIKYSANSFLATKITFINEIARLSDKVGANIKDIATAIGLDVRIGKQFLNAGIGYGGSCFPKDVKSLIHQFKENGLNGEIISKVDETNSGQVQYFLEKIFKYYNNSLHGKSIGVLGVAFKPGTDDLRESKGIEIIKKLMYAGAKLKIFDYNKEALINFKKYLDAIVLGNSRGFFEVEIVNNFEELTKNIDSLVITLEDKNILNEDFSKIKLSDNIIFDGKNILDKNEIKTLGINYVGVGC
ncbi:MAG: UDP-glucose/GDP-mannose dehydrogenase family protein [Candidatus Gracilibacteria bacterium]|nr:UDP-glucose/GDP-mannose dehydrogenase family protein [Candidatus Gracilibacteria bacterium]